VDDDFTVLLSGGRDSRHILLELCEQRRAPRLCVTARLYPPRADEDVRIAGMLTSVLGLRHVVLELAERFDAELNKNLATGFCSDEHTWALVLVDCLRDSAGAVFDGLAGDVLSAGLFLDRKRVALPIEGRFQDLAELIVPRSNERTLAHALRPRLGARSRALASVERVATELERHAEAANPIGRSTSGTALGARSPSFRSPSRAPWLGS
jgi:hypothetical protein